VTTSNTLAPPDDAVAVAIPGLIDDTEAILVAPNWKLVWWRFRKHRLAVICGVILLAIVSIALFPDFYSTLPPQESDAKRAFIPPQLVHFFGPDGAYMYVYRVKGERNPKTLMM
jgi:peptide/nickel transport system permease protein